ncbi:hypothetical protein FXO37_17773 [Capsicum annuum]|nr:hypothetical protein FXO37_17773 [Capsicum annuum]
MSSSNPTMRVEYVGKPMTPKISGDSAVERVGSSNEDNSKFIVSAEEDVVCSYDNGRLLCSLGDSRLDVARRKSGCASITYAFAMITY